MLKKWLFKIDKVIVWPLLAVTLLFLVTGFSMTHEAYRLIPVATALRFHTQLCLVFLLLCLAHVFINCYFAVERWKRKHVKVKFLLQLERFSGWILFIMIMIYMFSGFVMSGKLPLNIDTAVRIHRSLDIVIIIFLLHVGIYFYYVFRKWLR